MGAKFIDITGAIYGKLTVKGYVGKDKWGKTLWECVCECGSICIKDKSRFRDCQSCGCHLKEANFERCWKGCGQLSRDYWSHIQRNAKFRDIEFGLNIEYGWDLFKEQGGKCALSGLDIELSQNTKKKRPTASLDRINPNQGYIKGNVQWVHKKVNLCKHVQSNEDFLALCKTITEHNERR